jgi:hypothetical protein
MLMVTWGLRKDGSYGERIFIFKPTSLGVIIDVGTLLHELQTLFLIYHRFTFIV